MDKEKFIQKHFSGDFLRKMIMDYAACALWSSQDDDSSDRNFEGYAIIDIDAATMNQMDSDCATFYKNNLEDVVKSGLDAGQVGHDFWLTRNGHGAGFWDRGLEKALGERLSNACKEFKGVNLFTKDGKVFADNC